MRRGEPRLSALHTARTVIQRMAVRALDFLPPADCTIAEYGEALLAADRLVHLTDDSGYRAVVHGVLAGRGLVSKREVGLDESRWLGTRQLAATLGSRHLLFLHANRHRLALAPHADQRDFVVRDVQLKRLPTSPGEVAQIAIVYQYPVDVKSGPKRRRPSASSGSRFAEAARSSLTHSVSYFTRRASLSPENEWTRRSAFFSKDPRSSPSLASRSIRRGGRPRAVPGSRKSAAAGSRSGRIWPHAAGDRGGQGNEHHAARL